MAFIRQFETAGLGHAAYLVGDEASGLAFLVDPERHVDRYLDAAREAGVEIRWVLDTHAHNDYLSGVAALVASGVEAIAPIGASVGYPATLAWEGFELRMGAVRAEWIHVPGHTPEHSSILVTGLAGAPVLLSGGGLLVGDVGRPDLLGDGAQRDRSAHAVAASMRRLVELLPDEAVVLPTHLGGSFCAGAIGDEPQSTIGRQRASNPVLRHVSDRGVDADWLRWDLLPPVPRYWPPTRAANLRGVPAPTPSPVRVDVVGSNREGILLLDVREPEAFAAGHIPGSINVPLRGSFPVWAGIVAASARDVVIVAADEAGAIDAHRQLLRTSVEGAVEWIAIEDVPVDDLVRVPLLVAEDVAASDDARVFLDVRNPAEALERPVPGAVAIPATTLLDDPSLAPPGPLLVACASGYRAHVVASALRRDGIDALALDGSPFDLGGAAALEVAGWAGS